MKERNVNVSSKRLSDEIRGTNEPVHGSVQLHFLREPQHRNGGRKAGHNGHSHWEYFELSAAKKHLISGLLFSLFPGVVEANGTRYDEHHAEHDVIGHGEHLLYHSFFFLSISSSSLGTESTRSFRRETNY